MAETGVDLLTTLALVALGVGYGTNVPSRVGLSRTRHDARFKGIRPPPDNRRRSRRR